MRRNVSFPAATSFCWFLVLIVVCACAPTLWGANPDLDHSPGYSPHGLLNIPQTNPSEEAALAALPPETRGDLLMMRQQYPSAIHAYQQCPQDSAVTWNKLGIAYQHMSAFDVARRQYEKALSINSRYSEAWNNLGTVYYNQKKFHKAENLYHKALRIKPGSAAYYSNLGTAYFADRKVDQGIEAYQQAFELDPDVFTSDSLERISSTAATPEEQMNLNYALAELYAQAGNFESALHFLRLAFTDGFNNRKKLMEDKDFALLRTTTEFHTLMTAQRPN